MLYIDVKGDTVEDAVKIALDKLNLSEEDIRYEVMEQGKTTFIGIGKKKSAQIRVFYKDVKGVDLLLEQIKRIVFFLDPHAQIDIEDLGKDRYKISVKSQSVSHIIGKMGKALDSLQILVNALLQKHHNQYKVIVDVDEYNKKRTIQLLKWAKEQAEKVWETKEPIILKSLNSYERRLIHLELGKMEGIATQSQGEEKIKNIKIFCKE